MHRNKTYTGTGYHFRIRLVLAACLLATLVIFTGCSSGSNTYASSTAASEASYYELSASGEADYASSAAYEYEVQQTAEAKQSTEAAVPEEGSTLTYENTDPTRKIITTVDLRMESTGYDSCVSAIYRAIEASGGYIEYSDIAGGVVSQPSTAGTTGMVAHMSASYVSEGYSGGESYYQSGDSRYLFMRIRVPQGKLSGFLTAVETSGNVLTKQESAKDVTLEYTDAESHKRVLLVEQDRILAMLEKAEAIEEILYLEGRLTEIRYQIDSYESRLRLYDNQVNYSTVNLTLSEVIVYTEKPETPIPDPTMGQRISIGLNESFHSIVDFWTNLVVWLVVNCIYLLSLFAFALVIWLVFRRMSRNAKAGGSAQKPPNPPQGR